MRLNGGRDWSPQAFESRDQCIAPILIFDSKYLEKIRSLDGRIGTAAVFRHVSGRQAKVTYTWGLLRLVEAVISVENEIQLHLATRSTCHIVNH